MKTVFVLVVLTAGGWSSSVTVIGKYAEKAACEAAGERIVQTWNDHFRDDLLTFNCAAGAIGDTNGNI